jgi:hypothetical protein
MYIFGLSEWLVKHIVFLLGVTRIKFFLFRGMYLILDSK